MKKIILIIIISSLIFAAPGISVRQANAVLSTIPSDIVGWALLILKEAWNWAADNYKAILRDTIVKRILDAMVDDIVESIQGGGEPGFVTDFGGFMDDAWQAGVGDVAKELESVGIYLCEPFGAQLQFTVSYLPVEKFSERVVCTLDDIVDNIEDFYENFENGGWIAYNEIWKPQNNFYGAMLMTHDEMLIRGAKGQEKAKNEVVAGAGFLSTKICEGDTFGAKENCELYYEGKSCAKDKDNYWCSAKDIKITTPGSTIGGVVSEAMGKDINYMINVKSYTAAIVNALINRLFSEGLTLMGDSTSGGDSYDAGDEYNDIIDNELSELLKPIKDQYVNFLEEKQYILNAKTISLSSAEQILQILQSIASDCPTCLPQPTSAEIADAQAEVNRINNDITPLNNVIGIIDGLIEEIDNSDGRDRDISIINAHYNEFMDDYGNEIQEDVTYGDKRAAADTERTDKLGELEIAQNRINLCIALSACVFPTATSTTP